MTEKYINAEIFKRRVMEAARIANKPDLYEIAEAICEMVDNSTAADVAPVVHAEIRWINRPISAQYVTGKDEHGDMVCVKVHEKIENNLVGYCGRCGKRLDDTFMKFCPHCGAKMDGGAENG